MSRVMEDVCAQGLYRDPFQFKKLSKYDPRRICFTLMARLLEHKARLSFRRFQLPLRSLDRAIPDVLFEKKDTSVTPLQMGYLLAALAETERLADSCVAEIGCYHGITTRLMAMNTARTVFAVDPFIGYGGTNTDREAFLKNTGGLKNVRHLPTTSGEAARQWRFGPIGMVFVDAVHDYVNTRHDIAAWCRHMPGDAILAMHDVDNELFPGSRMAAREFAAAHTLVAHINDLALFRV